MPGAAPLPSGRAHGRDAGRRADAIGFLWQQYGAYHMDRCEAVGRALSDWPIVGLEIATYSETYQWEPTGAGVDFEKVTLFPEQVVDRLGTFAMLRAILAPVRAHQIRHFFVAGYELPAIALLAFWLRLTGVRVYIALDSKFDDKPRRLGTELIKRFLMLPYRGGFASGARAADYLRFLGFRRRPVAMGYDTVDLDRLRALTAATAPPWETRPFLIVARLVPKKNLATVFTAYAAYRATGARRRLRLCGAGPQEAELRAQAERLGIAADVDFLGTATQAVIAAEMAGALCLLLPSYEEQWGLVANEALAFALPIVVSMNVGARDLLIGNWSNGFVLDADDVHAWTQAMALIAEDRGVWQRFTANSMVRAELADTAQFVAGVRRLIAST